MTRPRLPSHVAAGALALALAPAFWPTAAAAHTCDDPFSTDLIAGRTIDAGDVKVCNDADTLFVEYDPSFPWCLLATDLHVATVPDLPAEQDDNIPQTNKGNPKPDEFAFGDEHDCAGEVTFEISLDEIGEDGVSAGDSVVIAAHAMVEDDAGREEGAWGDGTRFVERGPWAMYFTYEVQEPFLCGGADSKCVFVTSTTYNGNLGGLDGGDEKCQARAEADGSLAAPGTYKAWLSDAAASPSTRFTQASVPYKMVDGTSIGRNWGDLIGGSLGAPLLVTETGSAGNRARAWTGTDASGLADASTCVGWTVDEAGTFGLTGGPSFSSSGWTALISVSCAVFNYLYCFQE